MVPFPDDLLGALDGEAGELGLLRGDRASVLADLDALSRTWDGPVDAGALVRAERLRDG
jgi:hypothetical protein